MTDFELNAALLELLKLPRAWISLDGGYWGDAHFDFNNWNDLMPLCDEYNIGITPSIKLDGWIATYVEMQILKNKSMQRALAECLLKVLESKQ